MTKIGRCDAVRNRPERYVHIAGYREKAEAVVCP